MNRIKTLADPAHFRQGPVSSVPRHIWPGSAGRPAAAAAPEQPGSGPPPMRAPQISTPLLGGFQVPKQIRALTRRRYIHVSGRIAIMK